MPNAAGTAQIVCYFGRLDLASKLGDRRQMAVKSSEDRYFDEDVIGFLGTSRDAINVHDIGDGSTAGPVVSLLTAS